MRSDRALDTLEQRRSISSVSWLQSYPKHSTQQVSGEPGAFHGTDWFGEVPKNWEVVRLKFVVPRIEQGWSPDCHGYAASGEEWGVLKAGCCNNGRFQPEQNKAWT
jgi:type I restriction enzyme S subunit